MNKYIDIKQVDFSYVTGDGEVQAIKNLSLALTAGAHVAILGANGSGKSTLAKIISGLELPNKGKCIVDGFDSGDETGLWKLRRICGIVFQNPDNQIIGTTVEEDIAFGPENLGIPSSEIQRRVMQCASMVGLATSLAKPPADLSGGQKQKLAIAGVFAMEPRILILDEATSMLDPVARREILTLTDELGRKYNLTILNITHYMNEALLADTVVLMNEGKIVAVGTPNEIFGRVALLRELGLDVPLPTAIAAKYLRACGQAWEYLPDLVDPEAAVVAVGDLLAERLEKIREGAKYVDSGESESSQLKRPVYKAARDSKLCACTTGITQHAAEREVIIKVRDLTYEYPYYGEISRPAIQDISFDVYRGEILGVIGQTGSGKSTLIQHLNGLLRADSGTVEVMGRAIKTGRDIKWIRAHVGLLFQYPEHQLFADTVAEDIAYGPGKLGWSAEQIKTAVAEASKLVGLSEDIMPRSPFELSGGQKRRVAMAGVLAMRPDVLILDEPAAALDPRGRETMLDLIVDLRARGVTIVFVSHSMEDVARISDRILVMVQGKIKYLASPESLFQNSPSELAAVGITVPQPTEFMQKLSCRFKDLDQNCFSAGAVVRNLIAYEEAVYANYHR